jgi:hypothetical protein
MTEHYDKVCSICSKKEVDPAYFICESCRNEIKRKNNSENTENKPGENPE